MREGWVELRLGDFCEIQQGKNLAVSQLSTGKFPVYGANGVVGFYDEYNFSRELVALGCRGSCGTVHFVDEYAWLANNVMAIWPKSGNQAICQFVALLLETADLKSSGVISGQVQPQITRTSLGPLLCVLPPLVEQRRIVDLVASVDAYIAALEQQVDKARTARNAVLHELLSAGGDDWTESTLGELTANTRPICYGVLKPGPYVEDGVPLVRITDMDRSLLGPEGMHKISKELDNEFKRSRLGGNEVLLSIQGTVGRVARCAPELSGANISRTIALIDCDERLMNEFLALYLEHLGSHDLFRSSGSTRASLNISEIRQIKVPIPASIEQSRIVDTVSSMDEVIQFTEQAVEDAKSLRSGLLSDLLSGEHEIPELYDRLLGAA